MPTPIPSTRPDGAVAVNVTDTVPLPAAVKVRDDAPLAATVLSKSTVYGGSVAAVSVGEVGESLHAEAATAASTTQRSFDG